jgi:hypothetical protein
VRYLNTFRDALDDIRHELVDHFKTLPCKEWRIVVVAAELTDHKQRLGKEILAFCRETEKSIKLRFHPIYQFLYLTSPLVKLSCKKKRERIFLD